MEKRTIPLRVKDLGYSIRRFYVDDFYTRHVSYFNPDMKILDVGGKKKNKRGYFDIEDYPFLVEYANISPETEPDYLCDAAALPCATGSFDGVLCCEVLEHVPDPKAILTEIYRVLKPGGKALIAVPFMYHIHADPWDYGRYTEHYWRVVGRDVGFEISDLEYQGSIYAVMANLIKIWAVEKLSDNRLGKLKRFSLRKLAVFLVKALMAREFKGVMDNRVFMGHTTGFGIVMQKAGDYVGFTVEV